MPRPTGSAAEEVATNTKLNRIEAVLCAIRVCLRLVACTIIFIDSVIPPFHDRRMDSHPSEFLTIDRFTLGLAFGLEASAQ